MLYFIDNLTISKFRLFKVILDNDNDSCPQLGAVELVSNYTGVDYNTHEGKVDIYIGPTLSLFKLTLFSLPLCTFFGHFL